MMKIDVLTLFPEIILGPASQSILKRSQESGLLNLNVVNIRDFAFDKHKKVDELPYGGGPGMVMRPDVAYRAVQSVLEKDSMLIMMTPSGGMFDQRMAASLAEKDKLVILCGHYEGVDERIRLLCNPLCLSIGHYVLTNGALAAAVVIDAVVRLIPGVLGNAQSLEEESFSTTDEETIEYPQYTRPREFMGLNVPDVLLSGDHLKIKKWRQEEALKRTREYEETVKKMAIQQEQ
ncbi:MAG: tRNA (guanosine(37)-N1)-methyltransferase TrmD [Candidatus Aureabacteria bacterium]|nr:tRNA (guanosine(37)-N1)-methyltransferase TrmD [Candidatus Auribacterota bacterium]